MDVIRSLLVGLNVVYFVGPTVFLLCWIFRRADPVRWQQVWTLRRVHQRYTLLWIADVAACLWLTEPRSRPIILKILIATDLGLIGLMFGTALWNQHRDPTKKGLPSDEF